jgi:hypothetical protein
MRTQVAAKGPLVAVEIFSSLMNRTRVDWKSCQILMVLCKFLWFEIVERRWLFAFVLTGAGTHQANVKWDCELEENAVAMGWSLEVMTCLLFPSTEPGSNSVRRFSDRRVPPRPGAAAVAAYIYFVVGSSQLSRKISK